MIASPMGLPMEIIFHAHKAEVSSAHEQRAEQGLRKLERRLGRATAAVVRFTTDGVDRRVEITLEVARGRRYVAEGRGRYFPGAITEALERLERQVAHLKRTRKQRPRRAASA